MSLVLPQQIVVWIMRSMYVAPSIGAVDRLPTHRPSSLYEMLVYPPRVSQCTKSTYYSSLYRSLLHCIYVLVEGLILVSWRVEPKTVFIDLVGRRELQHPGTGFIATAGGQGTPPELRGVH